jgi:predicted dithiol-disulfide oxidoreductase (DUF899 family)
MTERETGTREEWRRARVELLELEKEHTRRGDELARMRREHWDAGCEGCSLVADHFDGGMVHLNQRDVTMTCVSRTSLEKINAYKRRMEWRFPWVSSLGSDFNFDFGVSFTDEQQANGAEYNFRWEDDPGDEGHGLSSFSLQDGVVYHVYSTYGRGTDVFNTFYQLLDRAPKGRDEDNIPAGEWWWRRHDEYGDG